MKFYLKAVVALFLFVGQAAAGAGIGPVGGLSVSESTVSDGDTRIGLDSQTNFTGGVTSEFGIYDSWMFFQPELLYIKKGASLTFGANAAKINFNYIELPLLFKAKVVSEPITPYFLFGPSIGYLTSASASVVVNGVSRSETINETKDFEFSLNLGAGIETALSNSVLGFFDIRYVHGLTNVSQDPGEDDSWKNRTWLFLVGARFGI